jgi:hypothetical protein
MHRRRAVLLVYSALALCLAPSPSPSLSSSSASSSSFGEQRNENAWGYVYAFRTLRLYPLVDDDSRIGRLSENDVVLTSARVSRRHGAIRRVEGGYEFVDVGSSNGSRLNGEPLDARRAVALRPGDVVQLADELLLFHDSLPDLWRAELEQRLLAGIVRLKVHLPQDETRNSFGRDEIVPAVTEARIVEDAQRVEFEHTVPLDPDRGFPVEAAAFVGNVHVERGVLELSLWTLERGASMTSRRSSMSNLKHTTLRLTNVGGDDESRAADVGPWFPASHLSALFDVFPDEPELALQFCHGLAAQERALALRDAGATFAFRFRSSSQDAELLVLAALARGRWVSLEVAEKRSRLSQVEHQRLKEAVEQGRTWLARARELGADDDISEEAEAVIAKAEENLAAVAMD